jgi:4-hydroxy-3-polyprenylbenzoate decarboxylase
MIGFPRIVVGIIGASGIAYGHRFLTALRTQEVETHLIVSRAACQTIAYEADWTLEDLHALADVVHPVSNIGASIASGSFKTTGMVIIPCSIRTLSSSLPRCQPCIRGQQAWTILSITPWDAPWTFSV